MGCKFFKQSTRHRPGYFADRRHHHRLPIAGDTQAFAPSPQNSDRFYLRFIGHRIFSGRAGNGSVSYRETHGRAIDRTRIYRHFRPCRNRSLAIVSMGLYFCHPCMGLENRRIAGRSLRHCLRGVQDRVRNRSLLLHHWRLYHRHCANDVRSQNDYRPGL